MQGAVQVTTDTFETSSQGFLAGNAAENQVGERVRKNYSLKIADSANKPPKNKEQQAQKPAASYLRGYEETKLAIDRAFPGLDDDDRAIQR